MKIRHTYAIVLRQLYLLRATPTRSIQLLWSILDVVLWGFITKFLGSVSASGFNFVGVLLGAVLLWDFSVRCIYGIATAFFEDLWARNLLNFFASPLTIFEYLTGLVVSGITTTLVSFVGVLVFSSLAFHFSVLAYGGGLLLFMLVLLLFAMALGIFGISVVLNFGPSAEWFIWPLPAIVGPFVGVFYPIATLPPVMQFISRLLPPSYVFEGARSIILHGTFELHMLLLGAGEALAYLFLAYGFFVFVYRRAIRTGLIARYSAETTS